GKPGVGKSHLVNEILEKYPDAIVYRFWTGSQYPNRNKIRGFGLKRSFQNLALKHMGQQRKCI
ncbi:MAG: hypothetical protein LBS36_09760, partial [Oscillospiraceae bacterium]|nr:hypothetical protein [Oscillospiraceae bacterium]